MSNFGFLWAVFEILTPFLGTFSYGHFETLLSKIYTPVLLVLPRWLLSTIVKRVRECNYQCKEQVGVGHFLKSQITENGPPSGQTTNCRKTEAIRSNLRIWGTCDSIESDPSDPKKWGLYGCSVKKWRFSSQKWASAAPLTPPMQRVQHKDLAFWCPVMVVTKSWITSRKKNRFGAKECIFGSKKGHFRQSVPENGPPSSRTGT